jgi:hypothetical protein
MFAFLVQKVNKIFSACCYFNRMPTAKINLSCARLFCGEMAKISETNGQFHCGPFLEKHNMPHISCLCSILISSLVAFPQKKIRNAQALKIISGPDREIKKEERAPARLTAHGENQHLLLRRSRLYFSVRSLRIRKEDIFGAK